MKALRYWLLLVVPASLIPLSVYLVNAHGPFYVGQNSDPEYCYLFNSLNILQAEMPGHTDHPGTTLQELGAGVVGASWLFRSTEHTRSALLTAVLTQPEVYLRDINRALVILVAAALFWAGVAVSNSTGSVLAGLVLQCSLFLFPDLVLSLGRVYAEPLLMAIGFAILAILAPLLAGTQCKDRSALVGAMWGAGMVTKVTFLPWIAIIAFFGPKQRKRFGVAALVAGSILISPIYRKLPHVAAWLVSLATHRERYGQGAAGLPSSGQLWANTQDLFHREPAVFAVLAFYAAMLAVLARESKSNSSSPVRKVLAVTCCVMVVQLGMTLKHYSPHYLVPCFIFAALANATVFEAVFARGFPPATRAFFGFAGTTIFAGAAVWTVMSVHQHTIDAQEREAAASRIAQRRAELSDCTTIGYYRSSLPSYVLNFASEYSRGVHGATLKAVYSDQIAFNRYGGGFWSFSLEPKLDAVRQMLAEGKCVLMQGTPFPDGIPYLPAEMSTQPVMVTESEALYRLALVGKR